MKYSLKLSLEILKQTPETLKFYLVNLSKEWLFANEGNDTWNAFDIIGHLIHGEKTDWIPRINIMLSNNENKNFPPFNRFAQMETSKGKSIIALLEEFKNLREKNLIYLSDLNLSKTQLKLEGVHPELGRVSIKELLSCWVVHDLGHIAQIARVMAKQYKTEVGPWEAYLPILNK